MGFLKSSNLEDFEDENGELDMAKVWEDSMREEEERYREEHKWTSLDTVGALGALVMLGVFTWAIVQALWPR